MRARLLTFLSILSVAAVTALTLEENTFYLLCYKRDIKCSDAEKELFKGRNQLLTGKAYSMIDPSLVPQVKVIECIAGH